MPKSTLASQATIDRVLKLNDVIVEHLTLEEDCHHSIKEIVAEAFEEDEYE